MTAYEEQIGTIVRPGIQFSSVTGLPRPRARVSASQLQCQGTILPRIAGGRQARASHGRLRGECLDEGEFVTLKEVIQIIEGWRVDCNIIRSHTSLCGFTLAAVAIRALPRVMI